MGIISTLKPIVKTVYESGRIATKFGWKNVKWARPKLDRVIYPAAVFLGSNTVLSAGIHYTNKLIVNPATNWLYSNTANPVMEFILGENTTKDIENGFDSYVTPVINLGLHAMIYGYANHKKIWQWTKNSWNKRKTVSKNPDKHPVINFLKTSAALAAGLYVSGTMNLYQDARNLVNTTKYHWNRGNHFSILTRNNDLVNEYLSGNKAADTIEDLLDSKLGKGIYGLVEDFAEASVGSIDDIITKIAEYLKVDDESERIIDPNENFPYSDVVSIEAQKYVDQGLFRTPEEFVYLVRTVYFEGGFDRKAGGNAGKLLNGMEGVVSVMRNRLDYDLLKGRKIFTKKNNPTLYDVAFRSDMKSRNGRKYRLWQFTCVRDHPEYFYEHKGKKNWDIYEGGSLNIGVGNMDPCRTRLAYTAVLNVLSGKTEDMTNGALFYQNIGASDKFNKNWAKRGLKKTTKINSHTFYVPMKDSGWKDKMNFKEYFNVAGNSPVDALRKHESPQSRNYVVNNNLQQKKFLPQKIM